MAIERMNDTEQNNFYEDIFSKTLCLFFLNIINGFFSVLGKPDDEVPNHIIAGRYSDIKMNRGDTLTLKCCRYFAEFE